jgi:hypothetical protein
MPIGNVGARETLGQIYQTETLHEAGLLDKADAAEQVGDLIGNLIASDDVTPSQAKEASAVLDRLTSEPPPSTGGIFSKLKQVFGDLRGKSATFEKTAPPQTREGLEKLKRDAQLATIPYTNKAVGDGFDPVLTSKLAFQVDVALRNDYANPETQRKGVRNDGDPANWGNFVDSKSGLAANIVVDKNSREVTVIFGGTTAGKYHNEEVNNFSFLKRSKNNALSTLSQWVSNIKAGLGIKPHSLEQAANLTSKVLEQIKNVPELQGYTVSTIGHSKGASEAVYAALSQKEPLKAVGFSSADLGGALVRGLPPENVARSKELVSHFHVKADIVPNLRFVTPSLRPLGKEAVIPAESSLSSSLSRHDAFANHIVHWADAQLAKPATTVEQAPARRDSVASTQAEATSSASAPAATPAKKYTDAELKEAKTDFLNRLDRLIEDKGDYNSSYRELGGLKYEQEDGNELDFEKIRNKFEDAGLSFDHPDFANFAAAEQDVVAWSKAQ